jgi:hypothetical protein
VTAGIADAGEAGTVPESGSGEADGAALATVTPINEAAEGSSGAHEDADATPQPTPDNVIPLKAR